MQRGTRPPAQPPTDASQRQPSVRRTLNAPPRSPASEHPPTRSTLRPTSELAGNSSSEAWGEQPPTSRTIPRPSQAPRSTITRSSPDRTAPLPSRSTSGRTLPPSAARTSSASHSVSPRTSRAAPPPRQDDAEVERMGQQIMELMERLRAGDERSAYLEQQLTHMTHMANAAAAAATALPPTLPIAEDFSPPKAANNSWIPWTAFGLLGALVAAAYVFGYTPLRTSYEEQVKQNALQASQSAQALASLRSSFGEERQRFESQLAAAQAAAATAAAAAPVEPAAPSSRSRSSDAAEEDEGDEPTRLTAEERAAKREERKAAYEARKAERLAKREERKAAALERKAAREEASASRRHGSSDDEEEPAKPARASKPSSSSSSDGDDPLQGLDGL